MQLSRLKLPTHMHAGRADAAKARVAIGRVARSQLGDGGDALDARRRVQLEQERGGVVAGNGEQVLQPDLLAGARSGTAQR